MPHLHDTEASSIPPPGETLRIGGDLSAVAKGRDGDYRFGPCRIDTPLPANYPRSHASRRDRPQDLSDRAPCSGHR